MERISKLLSLNSEQKKLLNIGKPYVVEASAGSGKTRVLVSRYLQILESGRADVNGIVAITFTLNAAKEMKDRIRSYISRYIDEYGENENINKATLKDIADAPITTIHGFAAGIIRENPYECNINSKIKILEGLDRKLFIDQSIDEFLSNSQKKDKYINELFENESYSYSSVKNNLIQILELTQRHHLSVTEDLFSGKDLNKETKALYKQLKQVIKTGPYGSDNSKIDRKLTDFYELLNQLEKHSLRAEKVQILNSALKILTNTGSPRGILELKSSSNIERQFAAGGSEIINRLITLYELQNTNSYLYLFLRFYEFYSEKKRTTGYLEFEDLLQKALKLLEDSPEILAHYQNRYKYFLIDEFQDTDRIQFDIINLFNDSNKFIVGDPKQSIFGFRGAVPEIFHELGSSENKSVLKSNFRSDYRLINFFNELFRTIIKKSYQEMKIVSSVSSDEPVKEIIRSVVNKGEDSIRVEAYTVAQKISELLCGGYEKKDIAVLLRSKSHIEYIENALSRKSIPYHSSESAGFYRYQEVRDIVSMLKYILNENDRISEASVLRSPFAGVTDSQLLEHYVMKKEVGVIDDFKNFVSDIRARSIGLNPLELVTRVLNKTLYMPAMLSLPQGKNKFDSITKLIEIISEQQNQGKSLSEIIGYLDLNYEENTEGLSQLELDRYDTVKILTVHKAKGLEFPVVILCDLNHGMGGGGETVCYSYKHGLVVRQKGVKSALWKDIELEQKHKDLEEEKRSLYVAMTRAKKKLVLSVCSDTKPKEGTYLKILDNIMMLSKIESDSEYLEFKKFQIPVLHYEYSHDMEFVDSEDMELEPELDKHITAADIKVANNDYTPDDLEIPLHLGFKINNIHIGSLMHRFLQIWNFDTGSIDDTIRFVLNESYIIEPKMQYMLRELAQNFLESELFMQIRDADSIQRELPFYIELDGAAERRKIDLLIFKDGDISLFDYKLSSEIKPEYLDQMDLYEKALVKRYGCNNISKNFVHIPEVVINNIN